ncbi:hypothetical protein [Halovulum marinum]|uniref:hypothetical protein n=1 Tax=Halovulum marinum TaxID=2662447 RepID=UPI001F34A638|nr:hypothetical protein [Halovulum marinum]
MVATAGLLVAAAGLAAGAAQAAQIERLATLSGPHLVMIAGDLAVGNDLDFLTAVDGVDDAIVLLRGPGGDPVTAMKIGALISARGYATAIVPESRCASGCALAWLAGATRYMAPDARVNLSIDTTATVAAPSAAALATLVRNYLRDTRLKPLFPAMTFRPGDPDRSAWLTPAAAQAAGIAIEGADRAFAAAAQEPPAETPEDAPEAPAQAPRAAAPEQDPSAPERANPAAIGTVAAAELDPGRALEKETGTETGAETATREAVTASGAAEAGATTGTGNATAAIDLPLSLPADQRWLVLESARSAAALRREADGLPADAQLIRVRTRNGMYATALGPFPVREIDRVRARLIRGGAIPRDAFISTGGGFVDRVD